MSMIKNVDPNDDATIEAAADELGLTGTARVAFAEDVRRNGIEIIDKWIRPKSIDDYIARIRKEV